LSYGIFGQTNPFIQTTTLHSSKDASVIYKPADASWESNNYGSLDQISILSGTHSGSVWYYRSFIAFDLSSIPENASILSANLYLYASGDHSQTSGSNECSVQGTTSSWSESTITY